MADALTSSFIENVNTIANATQAATGDILEDTQIARDEAQAAAQDAEDAAQAAQQEELLARDWAQKAYNNPVEGTVGNGDDKYSAYHWSVKAAENTGDIIINDVITSLNYTWSSQKISDNLDLKSNLTHNHSGIYEPVFTKGTAFNKDFNGTGAAATVSRSDHDHATVYEPLIGAKGTAFNKNFGTNPGTVMEGDTNFDDQYMPKVTELSAYNKAFVANVNSPQASEIPRGNHIHPADKISYDPTNASNLSSLTVQGALDQADTIFTSLTITERCKITGGSSAGTTIAITTAGDYEPILIAYNSVTSAKNAQYNDGIQVFYDGDAGTNPGDEGVKLVEGMWSATVTLTAIANSQYSITPLIKTLSGSWTIPNDDFSVEVGDTSGNTVGTVTATITGWISHLAEGTTIGIGITSTAVETITIEGITASFGGEQDGAIVASGTSVDHADLTGTGAAGGIHTISDIQDLTTTLADKMELVPTATEDYIATFDAVGQVKDSTTPLSDLSSRMSLVATPTLDNIITMDSGGDSLDSGVKIADLALVGGNTLQAFKVGPAVADEDAMQKIGITNLLTNYITSTIYNAHIAASNPHGLDYLDVGAAPTSHAHIIGNITGLQDALDDKYTKVVTPATDNVPVFETGGLLKDSGIAYTDIIQHDDYATDLRGGTIKIKVIGTDCYITTDGSTPGP